MNKQIQIFCILFAVVNGLITYDSGSKQFIEAGNNCKDGYTTTTTISFSQSFQNTPQVFIYLTRWTDTILIHNFQVKIDCPSSQVFYVYFNWYAIDDQRVQVINVFNFDNPVTKTFSHQNPNALYGFVTPISFKAIGIVDYNLQITSITKSTVTVGLTGEAGKIEKLTQIGYQIVLGIQEVFDILEIFTTALYNSGSINLQPNKWLLTPIVAATNPPDTSIRLWQKFTTTATTVTYNFDTWGYPYSPNTHKKIWMSNNAINQQYSIVLLLTVRISSKFDLSSISSSSIQLQMPQINQSYSSNGVYTAIVDQSDTPVLINVQMKCFNGKKFKSQFIKCNGCSGNKYLFNHFCHSNINQVAYFAKFTTATPAHYEFKITISDSEITVDQVVYHQLKTSTQILSILVLNF
ncbi:unnamed protein product [Paramecium sonneborni]|uniref:H-type lectin domain-containing protein n=1 Tax=Paramecium sonneborni TaxID=65129 RepID=A0A8S1PV08_9CILI|nr:unnamed protein product [Paramecium sonneborni]